MTFFSLLMSCGRSCQFLLGPQTEAAKMEEHHHTLAHHVVACSIKFLIILLSLFGNVLVCVAIVTDRRLRYTSNYFLVSLAAADLLVALVVMIPAAVNDTLDRWPFGAWSCEVWICSYVLFSTAAVGNLCVISLDRYLLIKDALTHAKWMTPAMVQAMIASVWVSAALISILPISLGWHRHDASVEKLASESQHEKFIITVWQVETPVFERHLTKPAHEVCYFQLSFTYALATFLTTLYLPAVVIMCCYFRIYQIAEFQRASIIRASRCSTSSTASTPKKYKGTITLAMITGTFFVCWTPSFVATPISAYCGSCIPKAIFNIFLWFGYFNSAMDPIIYTYNKDFRRAYAKIFSRMCRQSQEKTATVPVVRLSRCMKCSRGNATHPH